MSVYNSVLKSILRLKTFVLRGNDRNEMPPVSRGTYHPLRV